jgi:hypothetical protein
MSTAIPHGSNGRGNPRENQTSDQLPLFLRSHEGKGVETIGGTCEYQLEYDSLQLST